MEIWILPFFLTRGVLNHGGLLRQFCDKKAATLRWLFALCAGAAPRPPAGQGSATHPGICHRYFKTRAPRKQVRKQENKNSTKKVIKKKRKFFLSFFLGRFLGRVLVIFLFSCFLDRFLGRVLVFLFYCFLVFFYKFPPQVVTRWWGMFCSLPFPDRIALKLVRKSK